VSGVVATNGHTAPAEGLIPPSTAGGRSGFLSDVLIELGFADRESVEHAVRAARSPGTTVARALVEMSSITEEQLARAVAERHGVAFVDLDSYAVDPAAANLIKPAAARRYQAVPVGFVEGVLLVAMADPADSLGVNDIAHMTKADVQPAAAARPALETLLERLPLDEDSSPQPVTSSPPETEAPAGDAEPAEDAPDHAVEDEAPAGAASPDEPAADEFEDGAPSDDLHRARAEAEALRDELDRACAEAGALRDELDQARAEANDAAALRDELDQAREETETLRDELDRVRAKAEAAREKLTAVKADRNEAREHAKVAERRVAELERIEHDLGRRLAELQDAERRAEQAETALAELREELQDADRRAEQARQVLTGLREESEREREQAALTERDLRSELATEEGRGRQVQERLSELETAASAAERAFEELRLTLAAATPAGS
jgi:uncharacterized coiled-coil DUF342 family protein